MTDWQILDLGGPQAAKASLPPRLPVPPDSRDLEGGQLTRALAAGYVERFRAERPDDPLTVELEPFARKEPVWVAAEEALGLELWADARPLLEQILAIDPGDAAARFNLASSRRALGDSAAALRELEAIRPVFDDEGLYHANLARTYEELDRGPEAVAAYLRALELLPGDAFLVERLVELGALVAAADEQGNPIFVPRDEFEEAVREDLARNSEDAPYLAQVADALLSEGQDQLARSAAELALAIEPGRADALLFAGVADARLGQLVEALVRLDAHLELEPASVLGEASRASVLHALGRRDDAVAAAERTLELDPNQLTAAQIAVAGDDGSEAVRARAETLIAEHPGSWAAERVAGDLASHAEDGEAALAHWRRSVELGADDLTIGTLLGELGRQGRFDELCAIADDLVRLADRDPGLRWNVATGYAEAGRGDEARIVFASIAHDVRVPQELRTAAEQRAADMT